jgi:hypothetical protein
MLRRNIRLRKEYLYRKSLEGKEKEQYERKRQIRTALEGTGIIASLIPVRIMTSSPCACVGECLRESVYQWLCV